MTKNRGQSSTKPFWDVGVLWHPKMECWPRLRTEPCVIRHGATVGTIVSILDGSSRSGDPSVAPEKQHHLCEAFGLASHANDIP